MGVGCYWLLISRGSRPCYILCNAWLSSLQERITYPAQNITSAKFEKPNPGLTVYLYSYLYSFRILKLQVFMWVDI